MEETDAGLVVSGKVDLDTERGRDVWRSVKSNRVSFSFGLMVTDSVMRDDGVRELRAVDLYEISVTPTPANSDTRVLGWKSARTAAPWVDDEGQQFLRRIRDLEQMQRASLLDGAPARKAVWTAPIRVERFEVE
jgi:phage head maturation protease